MSLSNETRSETKVAERLSLRVEGGIFLIAINTNGVWARIFIFTFPTDKQSALLGAGLSQMEKRYRSCTTAIWAGWSRASTGTKLAEGSGRKEKEKTKKTRHRFGIVSNLKSALYVIGKSTVYALLGLDLTTLTAKIE